MENSVDQSKFYMWRTLFALVHADNVVTDEEVTFIANILAGVNFTDDQTKILKEDLFNAKDIEKMFKGITSYEDRMQFFNFARDLVWVDGDFCSEEQEIMIKLFKSNVDDACVDSLVGDIKLELEENIQQTQSNKSRDKKNVCEIISSFQIGFKKFVLG